MQNEFDKNLTVILTLKDRVPFTYRWMAYANESRFPFKILIADGGSDKKITEVLSSANTYPHLDYEYIRYPYDATYLIYHEKKVDVLSRVKTPFVVFADNDDFYIVDGLRQSVKFLSENNDYKTCKGQVYAFTIAPDANGAYGSIDRCLVQSAVSLEEDKASDRIISHFAAYSTTYYDVHHIEDVRCYFDALRDLYPKDVTIAELLTSLMAVASGKIKTLSVPYLLRQHHFNTNCTREDSLMDRFDRVLLESWSDDFVNFNNAVASIISAQDGISLEDAMNNIKKGYRKYIAPVLINDLLKEVDNNYVFASGADLVLTKQHYPSYAYRRIKSYLERKWRQKKLYSELMKNQEVLRVRDFLIKGRPD
jgi:glycosyltransferase domain-containing protein